MEVPGSREIIPVVNQLISHFELVYAAIDWHPANHISFAGNYPWRHIGQILTIDGRDQELLPFHCVKDSFGAKFFPGLNMEGITEVIHKGTQSGLDDHSCFFDADFKTETGLHQELLENKVQRLFIAGLSTDGGVKKSVLDGLKLGFEVFFVEDACKALNKTRGSGNKAQKEMEEAGAVCVPSNRLIEL